MPLIIKYRTKLIDNPILQLKSSHLIFNKSLTSKFHPIKPITPKFPNIYHSKTPITPTEVTKPPKLPRKKNS